MGSQPGIRSRNQKLVLVDFSGLSSLLHTVLPDLIRLIVSQISSYIVSSSFLRSEVRKFYLGRHFQGAIMGVPLSKRPLNLIRLIVSQKTSNIESSKVLCSAV